MLTFSIKEISNIEKIYPEVVITDKDGYKSVDYSRLTPILLEAIKELKAEKDAEIEAMKAKLQQLEELIMATTAASRE
ncbi:MAG: hypothetical protein ACE5GL_03965 [Calditrichia bacterium]